MGYTTSRVGIHLACRGHPSGPTAPRGVPSTLGGSLHAQGVKAFTTSLRSGNVTLLFRIDKSSRGVSRIDEATPWDACPYAKSNANTFVRARAYRVFRPRVSGSTSGAPLGAFGTLGVPPRLIPPHSVGKPYTNSPSSSIVTIQHLPLDLFPIRPLSN